MLSDQKLGEGGEGRTDLQNTAAFPIVDISQEKKNHLLHLIISDILSIML